MHHQDLHRLRDELLQRQTDVRSFGTVRDSCDNVAVSPSAAAHKVGTLNERDEPSRHTGFRDSGPLSVCNQWRRCLVCLPLQSRLPWPIYNAQSRMIARQTLWRIRSATVGCGCCFSVSASAVFHVSSAWKLPVRIRIQRHRRISSTLDATTCQRRRLCQMCRSTWHRILNESKRRRKKRVLYVLARESDATRLGYDAIDHQIFSVFRWAHPRKSEDFSEATRRWMGPNPVVCVRCQRKSIQSYFARYLAIASRVYKTYRGTWFNSQNWLSIKSDVPGRRWHRQRCNRATDRVL